MARAAAPGPNRLEPDPAPRVATEPEDFARALETRSRRRASALAMLRPGG